MHKKLKYWNGRGHGEYSQKHISVAAYSKKQAAELVSIACESPVSVHEISEYYAPVWGISMDGIDCTTPSVYVNERFSTATPRLIYSLN